MELPLKILIYSSYFSVLLPLLCLFTGKQNFKNPVLKWLAILLVVAAFSELIGFVWIKTGGKSNLIIDNCYTLFEFLILSYLYYWILSRKGKILVYGGVAVFIVFFRYL